MCDFHRCWPDTPLHRFSLCFPAHAQWVTQYCSRHYESYPERRAATTPFNTRRQRLFVEAKQLWHRFSQKEAGADHHSLSGIFSMLLPPRVSPPSSRPKFSQHTSLTPIFDLYMTLVILSCFSCAFGSLATFFLSPPSGPYTKEMWSFRRCPCSFH